LDFPTILHRAAEIGRRLASRPAVYDPILFVDRPLSSLGANSMYAERDAGGWRGFAGVVTERKWSDIFTLDVFLTRERPGIVTCPQ